MVAVRKYLKQTVSLQRQGETDPIYGDITYDAPVDIPARYVQDDGLVRTSAGDEINVKGTVLTEEVVALGDLIEGTEVKGTEALVDKAGRTLGYRVFL